MDRRKKKQPYPPGKVQEVPTDAICPNPQQPRRSFPLAGLVELAQSISENGIIQPLTVTWEGDTPILVAGERRLRAAKIAGLATVPCLTVEATEEEQGVWALLENIQRQDLNCFEVAVAMEELVRRGMPQWEVAKRLGFSPSAVANKIRLLRLSPEIRKILVEAGLGERHGRALLRLGEEQREEIAARMAAESLTAEQAERLVESLLKAAGKPRHAKGKPLIKDVRVFFNTVNHALEVMRRGGILAEATRTDGEDYIEYVVRIPTKT